jgi:hypothetical protein
MSLTDYNISIIFGITFIMVIWLNSDIVQTIAKLTNTRSLFKLDEYQLYKSSVDPMSTYPNFLYSEYTGYITKLLSCVICLCFWTTLFSIVALLYTLNYPLYYIVMIMPVNYICSLLLYLLINKLL